MEIVKLLLLTLLPAVVLGCLAGVLAGKHKVKKEAGQLRPILSTRQRIVYSVSILVGISCILFAVFYTPQPDMGEMGDGMGMDSDFYEPGIMTPDWEEPMTDREDDMLLDPDAMPEEPLDFEEEPAADEDPQGIQPEAEAPATGGGGAIARPMPRQATASVNGSAVWVK